jgi:hypothetical protein
VPFRAEVPNELPLDFIVADRLIGTIFEDEAFEGMSRLNSRFLNVRPGFPGLPVAVSIRGHSNTNCREHDEHRQDTHKKSVAVHREHADPHFFDQTIRQPLPPFEQNHQKTSSNLNGVRQWLSLSL